MSSQPPFLQRSPFSLTPGKLKNNNHKCLLVCQHDADANRAARDRAHWHTHSVCRRTSLSTLLRTLLRTLFSAFSRLFEGSQEQGSPRTRLMSRSGAGKWSVLLVFYIGVIWGRNPCEHRENVLTPHRKIIIDYDVQYSTPVILLYVELSPLKMIYCAVMLQYLTIFTCSRLADALIQSDLQ